MIVPLLLLLVLILPWLDLLPNQLTLTPPVFNSFFGVFFVLLMNMFQWSVEKY